MQPRHAILRSLAYAAILAAICPWAGAYAATIPDCAGNVEIARARVIRVEKNGALVLSDGRAVMLEGIRLPEEDSQRDRALGLLRTLTAGDSITFTATPPKEDRYDRIRAQGFARRAWLQEALLEKGLARVAVAPDRNECAPDLYEAEARARGRHEGLWASAANAPRPAEMLRRASSRAPEGSFQLVEGQVTRVARAGGRIFIDFSGKGRQDFSAIIQPEDRGAFRGFDLEGLETHRIRIRGIVQDYRGRPEIALSNPAQIEIIDR